MAYRSSKLSPLERRVPRNPKYANVKSTLDTGMSERKVKVVSTREYLNGRDELYHRIRATQLTQLMEKEREKKKENLLGQIKELEKHKDMIHQQRLAEDESANSFVSSPSKRSAHVNAFERHQDAYGRTNGMSSDNPFMQMPIRENQEVDRNDLAASKSAAMQSLLRGSTFNMVQEEAPFLLLDLRSKEDYNACHITGAAHYPASKIRHDVITREIHAYKNKRGKIIILYDNEERLVRQAATTFVEKGFENIFILSDGLYRFGKKYPQYCDGVPPVKVRSTKKKRRTKKRRPLGSQPYAVSEYGSTYAASEYSVSTTVTPRKDNLGILNACNQNGRGQDKQGNIFRSARYKRARKRHRKLSELFSLSDFALSYVQSNSKDILNEAAYQRFVKALAKSPSSSITFKASLKGKLLEVLLSAGGVIDDEFIKKYPELILDEYITKLSFRYSKLGSINSMKLIANHSGRHLRILDLQGCFAVSNHAIIYAMENLPVLEELGCAGCRQLTDNDYIDNDIENPASSSSSASSKSIKLIDAFVRKRKASKGRFASIDIGGCPNISPSRVKDLIMGGYLGDANQDHNHNSDGTRNHDGTLVSNMSPFFWKALHISGLSMQDEHLDILSRYGPGFSNITTTSEVKQEKEEEQEDTTHLLGGGQETESVVKSEDATKKLTSTHNATILSPTLSVQITIPPSSTSSLVSLSLGFSNFTSNALTQVLQSHSGIKLLEVHSCPCIERSTIMTIASLLPKLEYLNIKACENITGDDVMVIINTRGAYLDQFELAAYEKTKREVDTGLTQMTEFEVEALKPTLNDQQGLRNLRYVDATFIPDLTYQNLQYVRKHYPELTLKH
eukprot:g1440.t1